MRKWLRHARAHPLDAVISTASFGFALWLGWVLIDWALIRAVFVGHDRAACSVPGAGACWPFVTNRFGQFIYGFYPVAERWRPDLVFFAGALLLVPLLMPRAPFKLANALALFVVFPVVATILLRGGWFGLVEVRTQQWGGLLVTLVVSATGMAVSLPLGILLAYARRSHLPVVSGAAIVFIEFWRGVPLITVLFCAIYVLPLFVPPGWRMDHLVSALVGVGLFASAYMAEVIRGGLQAVPMGQREAAAALGLTPFAANRSVVLPQALRMTLPGVVNTFIGLLKDTTLVAVVGIYDLLNQIQTGFNDPNWAAPNVAYTGFAFAAAIYLAFCFGLSRYALFIEKRAGAAYR